MKYIITLAFVITIAFALSTGVLAATGAEMLLNISDFEAFDDCVEFTLSISLSRATQPYSSLDFNLVSSDYHNLTITNNNPDGSEDDLAISFVSGYGSAYHKGRVVEDSGEISYLIGIFSTSGGNTIIDETDICSVRLRYSGITPQHLSIRDLRLIYKTPAGLIDSVLIASPDELTISLDLFVEMEDLAIATSEWNDGKVSLLKYWPALLCIVCIVICSSIIKARLKRKAGV